MRLCSRLGVTGAAALLLAPAAFGQSIADRVDEVRDGKVRMRFAARPGVCGDGCSSISMNRGRSYRVTGGRHDVDWDADCEYGPVRVVLRVRGGEVTDVDTYVGGRWRPAAAGTVDLGTLPAQQAVDYLLALARRARGDLGGAAVLPTMLADSVTIWPELLDMAKDESISRRTRKSAVFWLGQAAGEEATEGLAEIVGDVDADRDVRKTAVFALSQRPRAEGVPALIHVVRTNRDPQLVRQALFWLSQSDDPRAIELFEEILLSRQ